MKTTAKDSPVCLGLDPANLFGWSIGRDMKILAFGTEDIPQLAKFYRCSNVRACEDWLTKLIKEHRVTNVCAEDAAKAFKGVNALISHARYKAIIDLVCEKQKVVQHKAIGPSTLKAVSCDNGRADKGQMIKAARLLYQIDVSDDNAADACHVAMYLMNQLKKNKPPF